MAAWAARLDRLGHVEVRLADAEVDGVLETSSQFEHLADARDLDRIMRSAIQGSFMGVNRSLAVSRDDETIPDTIFVAQTGYLGAGSGASSGSGLLNLK